MLAYIVRKVIFSLVVLFAASVVVFGLVALGPDPLAELRQNPRIRGEDLERIANLYGLNEPLHVQYAIWMGDMLRGDFGQSFKQNAPVSSIIAPRVWPTILLMGASLLLPLL